MSEFYTWPMIARSFVVLLIAFCVIVQTFTVVASFYRRPRSNPRLFENILELFVLFHVIVLSLLMGQLQQSHHLGLIVPTGYIELRYIAAACVVFLSSVVIVYRKKVLILLVIAASCLMLPFTETVFGGAYAGLYIIALFFWLLRSILVCIQRFREITSSISVLSIKDAVDSLHTGVLFSEPEGAIALVNVQMQRLMNVLTGKLHRNSRYFYELLMSGELSPGCLKAEYEEQIVCILPDETAWVFTRTEILIKKKQYFQITATDITVRWALTAELQQQEKKLILRGEELKEMIVELQTLSQTRQLQNAKLRAHDVLGQRLTMLLHSVSSGKAPDYNLLSTQLYNLLNDLKSDQDSSSPLEKLDNLRRTFNPINVDILLDGELPEDELMGLIFVDIISESVVNAVRHGFASKVFVRVESIDDIWYLEISDNGNRRTQLQSVKEGGGIGGMRNKIEAHGGVLVVTNHPQFRVRIKFPGGTTDV